MAPTGAFHLLLESQSDPPDFTTQTFSMAKSSSGSDAYKSITEQRSLVVIHAPGEHEIVRQAAEALGWPLDEVEDPKTAVQCASMPRRLVGIANDLHDLSELDCANRQSYLILNAFCMDHGTHPHQYLSMLCDYEYLYNNDLYMRRDLVRYLSVILGLSDHHHTIRSNPRSKCISTTFSDVQDVFDNLDIISVGIDAIELRVDLLRDSGKFPGLQFVGRQVMLLRQRTNLPLIFSIRCTRNAGKFPMEDPELCYKYLFRAKQWGCEYIDVEQWLPESVRKGISDRKGHSRIISTFHDLTGTFKWRSSRADAIYTQAVRYGDVVKMVVRINNSADDLDLEEFRARREAQDPRIPLMAINIGEDKIGHPSKAFNNFLTPSTHPLMSPSEDDSQLSAAEINATVRAIHRIPEQSVYCVDVEGPPARVMFVQRCLNELNLKIQFTKLPSEDEDAIQAAMSQKDCAGASLTSLTSVVRASFPSLTSCSHAAQMIDRVDTIWSPIEQPLDKGAHPVRIGENSEWIAICKTLTMDFTRLAYLGRTGIVLATTAAHGAAAIYALKCLGMSQIHTIGFKTSENLRDRVTQMQLEHVRSVHSPFVLVNALPPDKSKLAFPLLEYFGGDNNPGAKVYLECFGVPSPAETSCEAERQGWKAYNNREVLPWQTAVKFKLLVGQHVPFGLVQQSNLW